MNWDFALKPMAKLLKRKPEIQALPDEIGQTGWYRVLLKTTVRSDPDLQSPIVHFLLPGKTVHVIDVAGRRALIDLPVSGWVSLVSAAGQNICEAIHNQTPLLPMPSDIFDDNLLMGSEHIDNQTNEAEVLSMLEDREIIRSYLINSVSAQDVFIHFQNRAEEDLQKLQLIYAAVISAFVSTFYTSSSHLVKKSHIQKFLRKFVNIETEFNDYQYRWSHIELILTTQIQNDFTLFQNATTLLPWEAAPIARTAQEYQKHIQNKTQHAPDAICIRNLEEGNGVYKLNGYYNMRPLYIKEDELKCVRWFGEAWYLDTEVRNEDVGIAKLELNRSFPTYENSVNWLIWDETSLYWQRNTRIRCEPILFTEHEL